jgi:Immunity protein 26
MKGSPVRDAPLQEGDWFAVPLDSGGYALGLAARVDPRGIVLGYFVGPRRVDLPAPEQLTSFSADDAFEVCFFADTSLRNGRWPLLGRIPGWDRTRWPLPAFGRRSIISDHSWRVEFDEGDLSDSVREVPISVEECKGLPPDGLSGDRAMEISLTRWFGGEVASRPGELTPGEGTRFFLYFASEDMAHRAANKLSSLGYESTVECREPGEEWVLLAVTKGDMSQLELSAADLLMSKTGIEFAGQYDGYDRPVSAG